MYNMHVHMTFTETTTKHNYANWDSEVSHLYPIVANKY